MNVVSFSGGKDSTAMLLMMIEKGIPIDRIICIDTTKEFPQMYEHIAKVQEMIRPLEIEIIKIDFDYWFGEHIKTKGKRKGEKGYGFPDFMNRWCTALKRDTVAKLQNTLPPDTVQFQGIAAWEKWRIDRNTGRNIRYPLIEWGIDDRKALKYCYSKGLDWGGLYKKFKRVSCWCCPLATIDELRVLYNEFPELWAKLEEMDKKSFRKFRNDYSVQELKEKFDRDNLKRSNKKV